MTTALSALRPMVARRIPFEAFYSSTTTSAGTVDSLVDTSLKNYPDGFWDDGFVRLDGGTYTTVVKRVKSHAQSTGVIAPLASWAGAPGSAVAYSLYNPYSPDQIDQAIKDAVREAYPSLCRRIEYKDFVLGSRLLNGSFEDWTASNADNWTKGSNVEDTQETTIVWHGASSCKLVATGAATYYQSISATIATLLEDCGVTFYAWVWADTASIIRLYITDGDGTTYGDYHTGSSRWELLSVTRTVNNTMTRVGFQMSGAETCYVDDAHTEGGPSLYEYGLSSTFANERVEVDMQDDATLPEGPYTPIHPSRYDIITLTAGTKVLRFKELRTSGYHLRVRGMAYLETLTTDASTVLIDEPETGLLVEQAIALLLRRRPEGQTTMDEATRMQWMQITEGRIAQLKRERAFPQTRTARGSSW